MDLIGVGNLAPAARLTKMCAILGGGRGREDYCHPVLYQYGEKGNKAGTCMAKSSFSDGDDDLHMHARTHKENVRGSQPVQAVKATSWGPPAGKNYPQQQQQQQQQSLCSAVGMTLPLPVSFYACLPACSVIRRVMEDKEESESLNSQLCKGQHLKRRRSETLKRVSCQTGGTEEKRGWHF
uniref:Uncharacterized protein n=1 Tax=Onchocerca volvulus TaxID=6282 RepID=A0A8R1XQA7_ONCVO